MPPTELSLITWGLVSLFAGVDFVRYYPVSQIGVGAVISSIVATWVISVRLSKRHSSISNSRLSASTVPPWLLSLAQTAAILVIIGLMARVYHTGFVNNRGLSLDIGERYLASRQESQRSVGAILAWLTGFWVLPLGVAILYGASLSFRNRFLLLATGLGSALNTYYLGGRSGIGLTAMAFIGLYLMMLQFPSWRSDGGRIRRLALLGTLTLVTTGFLAYLFEKRFQVTQDSHRYSSVMDLNPAYAGALQLMEKAGISEAVIGTIGYLGSPVQQWSMYLDLGLEARLGGAFNFDLPAMVLRKIGIGEISYAVNMTETMDVYENVANAPLGTFSTVLRDLHLDYGWTGIVVGLPLFCLIGDISYYRLLKRNNLEYIPVIALWFGLMGFNPITSGLQISGGNQAFFAALICWWLIRNAARRQQVRLRPIDTSRSARSGAGAAGMTSEASNP